MPVFRFRKALLVLLSALAVGAFALMLSGCGAKEPAYDMALGAEADQAIYVTNATGQTITGLAVAEEGADPEGDLLEEDAVFADAQVAKIFIASSEPESTAEEEAAEEVAAETAGETAEVAEGADVEGADDAAEGEGDPEAVADEPATLYDMLITFEDGTTATLYGFNPLSVDEFSLCYEDEVAFFTYTDDQGNEISTKEAALEKKSELDRIAAEEAAAEAAAQAAQQQYYYVNSYGADSSAGQGKTGCLF